MDEPKASGERNKPEKEKSGGSVVPATMFSNPPTSASENQTNESSKSAKYRQYVVRSVVAIWRTIKFLLRFADEHDGAITALATIAIVILTFFYVRYSRYQWRTMRDQVGQMQSQERPWVSVSKDGFHELVPSDVYDVRTFPHEFRATIVVINSGRSPALRVRTTACWIASSNEEYNPPSVEVCHTSGPLRIAVCQNGKPSAVRETPLFPGGGYNTTNARETFKLSASEIDGIRHSDPTFPGSASDKQWLYVVGCSTYDDGGGNHYRTQFCMLYAPKGPPSPLDILHPPGGVEANSVGYYNKVYRPCAAGNSTEKQQDGKYVPD